jgi:hypothetical protein
MKKLLSTFVSVLFCIIATAQVSKTINVSSAGTLSTLLTDNEKSTITSLTITGNIDARDFRTMRDYMSQLEVLNIASVYIKSYNGSEGTIMNSTTSSYPANEIPNSSFYYQKYSTERKNTKLRSVNLPANITKIGEMAFRYCSALADVNLPNSIREIGMFAFSDCTNLKGNLTLPNSITTIGYGVFSGCIGLNGSLTLSSSLKEIGHSAFYGCKFTGNLSLPNTLTSIGGSAFSDCSGFTGNLIIPNLVIEIGREAFLDCFGFKGNLVLPNSITKIFPQTFRGCFGFTGNLIIPNTVSTIEGEAFSGCKGFNGSLTLPKLLFTIEYDAFKNCSGFKSIYCEKATPSSVTNNIFSGTTSVKDVFVPTEAAVTAYQDSQWYLFFPGSIIKVGAPNAISNFTDNNIKVYANSNGINIEGLVFGENISLCNASGKQLRTLKSQGEQTLIKAQKNSIYLIKTKGKVYKVIL